MRSLVAASLLLLSCNALALTCPSQSASNRLRTHAFVVLVEVTAAQLDQSEGFLPDVPGLEDSSDITVSDRRVSPKFRRVRTTVRVVESFKGQNVPTELTIGEFAHRPEVTVGAFYLISGSGPAVSIDCGGVIRISSSSPESMQLLRDLRAEGDT